MDMENKTLPWEFYEKDVESPEIEGENPQKNFAALCKKLDKRDNITIENVIDSLDKLNGYDKKTVSNALKYLLDNSEVGTSIEELRQMISSVLETL
jgi:hypothetical protein